jgi:paraquat-inducible protein B
MPRATISIIGWLPVLIALIALACVIAIAHAGLMRGPQLCITLTTAEGLQVGKTRLRYRSVEIGQLETLRISKDRSHVTAVVRLQANAARHAGARLGRKPLALVAYAGERDDGDA